MNLRGKKVKFIYTQFAQNLAKDAGRYLPQQPQKPAARKADVHSMHSNKIPIAVRVDTSRSQFNANKPAALCAVSDPEDSGDTFDAARTDDLAAMTTRQEGSTKKRSEMRLRILRTRHGHRVRGDTWTTGPMLLGFRKRREPSPWAPRIAEVEDALLLACLLYTSDAADD